MTQATLADLQGFVTHIEVACSRCDRGGWLNVARLIGQYGLEAKLRDAMAWINVDCPQANMQSLMQRCDVYFPDLGALITL